MITTTFYLTSIFKSLYSLFLMINRGIINYVLGKLSKRGVRILPEDFRKYKSATDLML